MVINGKALTGPCTAEEFGAIAANLFSATPKKFINMPANIMRDTVIRMDAIDYISLEAELEKGRPKKTDNGS